MPVLDDDILEDDRVEGLDRDGTHLDVRVHVPGELLHRFPRQIGLDGRGLDDDKESEQQQQQDCQHPERYAKTLLHQSTNIMILREEMVIFAPRNENYGRYYPWHRIFL